MPSTFIDLTNRLLRRLNEVEISQSDFPSTRGIHSTAKDCIIDSVNEINQSHADWPFNAVQHSQNLEVGTEEYGWPPDFQLADWYSFQLQADDTLNVKSQQLKPIAREEWYNNLKDRDDDSSTTGIRRPIWVSPSHGQGFAVSPSPDQEYPIKFRYYKTPSELVNYDDQVTIPQRFNYVIMAGALYHLNIFKENAEAAQLSERRFLDGISVMTKLFLPNPSKMFVTNMNKGNTQRGSGRGIWTGN